MNKGYILKVAGIIAGAFFLGCEPVPHNAITDARTALEKAEKAGAQNWAPAQLKRGHALYDSAMKELAVEKGKLPFNRNYNRINDILDIAAEAGHYALKVMHEENERIRSRSLERLDRAKNLADSIDGVLKAAATQTKNIVTLQAALDSARMAQKEALAVLNSGDLLLAEEKVMWAGTKIEEVVRSTAGLITPPHTGLGRKR
ncbi:MAG: hypothetical protein JW795_18055 [Chitinivibrionales bacterium]|nr:hypothetical protein [Chitinivibrionales bacterium]